ncbi:MAG: helix-turn-helix domain-containing protein [Chitinophagaceae bacterium]
MEFTDKQIHILETAEKLFADKGFEGTSVREIAKETNMNLAAISYHFGSKEKLMEAIFNYRINNTWFAVKSLVSGKGISPVKKIELLIDSVIDKISEKECFHRIMVRQQILAKDDLVSRLITESRVRNIQLLNEIVQEGQDQKLFKKKVDTPLLIITMIGTIYQMMNTQDFYRQANKLESLEDAAFQVHIRRVLKIHLKTLFKTILTNEA